jgi:hypothetical protein
VLGERLIDLVEVGIVEAGSRHCRLGVINHGDPGQYAKELEGADVSGDPVQQLLRGQRLGVHVVAGTERGDEELGLRGHAADRVDDGDGAAGEVDEELLAGAMLLAHDHIQRALPEAVEPAELLYS